MCYSVSIHFLLVLILQRVTYQAWGQNTGSGICSWYGAEGEIPEGHSTGCPNEEFSRYALATASPTLPCGTIIAVTNLSNDTNHGQSVTVRVNDKGPGVPGRILDLTWAAFSKLDDPGVGIIPCNYTVVSKFKDAPLQNLLYNQHNVLY